MIRVYEKDGCRGLLLAWNVKFSIKNVKRIIKRMGYSVIDYRPEIVDGIKQVAVISSAGVGLLLKEEVMATEYIRSMLKKKHRIFGELGGILFSYLKDGGELDSFSRNDQERIRRLEKELDSMSNVDDLG